MNPTVRVNRKAADRAASGHLWLFSSDIVDRGSAQPGDAVRVEDHRGRLIGMAHYSSTSQITLRLLSQSPVEVNRAFWMDRLKRAIDFRQKAVQNSSACRLVYAEGDLLPALIVDRYGEYLVVQTLNQGMDRAKAEIVSCLEELLKPRGILERNDATVREREGLAAMSGVLAGEAPERVEVEMNGRRFFADLSGGQKTGLFLDQRENYAAAGRWASGTALDCFCSATAGFAMHMAPNCEKVEAIDSSASALKLAEAARDANGLTNISFREANVFDLLISYRVAGRRYSTIVLDPPAFAKARGQVDAAMRGYKEINLRGLQLLESGGILITCSCSHHISESAFIETVAAAALDAKKRIRILERRTQAQDHPILLTVPETHYLKCLILEVI